MKFPWALQLKTQNFSPKTISFGCLTTDNIKKNSVITVTKDLTFDKNGKSLEKGLYDLSMGPVDAKRGSCESCTLSHSKCPGHFGLIQLPLPVFNPLFKRELISLLKMTCLTCKKLKASDLEMVLLSGQLALLQRGFVTEAQQLIEFTGYNQEINGSEQDDPKEMKRGTSKKKSTPKKFEWASPVPLQEAKIAKIQAFINQTLAKKNLSVKEAPSKTVESLRLSYIKGFENRCKASKCCQTDSDSWGKLQFVKSQLVYTIKSRNVVKEETPEKEKELAPKILNPDEASGVSKEDGVVLAPDKTPKKTRQRTPKKTPQRTPKKTPPRTPKRTPQRTPKRTLKKTPGKTPTKLKESASKILNPEEARDHLRETWNMHNTLIRQLYPDFTSANTDMFFLDVIPVIPSKFRSVNFLPGRITENGLSTILSDVILEAKVLEWAAIAHKEGTGKFTKDALKVIDGLVQSTAKNPKPSYLEKYQAAYSNLQRKVDLIVDASKDKRNLTGFKQIIEQKKGILRNNMMGKRVNYAGRSVITPDPYLDVEEVGVPDCFAMKLTYPVPVTSHNYLELQELVRNGPNIYPGALAIEDENGILITLSENAANREPLARALLPPTKFNDDCQPVVSSDQNKNRESSLATEKQQIVHRHLQNGDPLILNRQPTLHKPSVMAHKARVLTGEKTLRLHYANCKAYNADFDGDEMNVHCPQDEVARSEALNIVGVAHQYLVPRDGTPLTGLIQDHVISGVKMTIRGKFFNREDYQQLVFSALGGHLYHGPTKLLPPAILKPVALWSGKQIISTVIMNLTPKGKPLINMKSTSKISVKDWQTVEARPWKGGGSKFKSAIDMSESEVIIRHGELLCGVLDKQHYGATSFSLVHGFNELYGGEHSCRLLSSFSRLFTFHLQLQGFTLGVKDILVTPKADQNRKKIIGLERVNKIGSNAAAKAFNMKPELLDVKGLRERFHKAQFNRLPHKRIAIDREYKTETDKITNEVNKACIPNGLLKQFPDNNLSLMIQSGAKGSSVNAMQISSLLGQVELEGKRPPLMFSGRSLPSFRPYDTSPRAGGFISGRFLTGLRPQEFFFHCMAGREGLIDTAVKTANSGYLQRCLVKHLEGIKVEYDNTVRDSDGTVLQFRYGEDGLDVCKSQYLSDKGIPFLVDNIGCLKLADVSVPEESEVEGAQSRVQSWTKEHESGMKVKERKSGFLTFSSQIDAEERPNKKRKLISDELVIGRSSKAREIVRQWKEKSVPEKKSFAEMAGVSPDPVGTYNPLASNLNMVNGQVQEIVSRYLKEEEVGLLAHPDSAVIDRKQLTRLVYSKSIAASCDPGEAVGMLAALSIGEPSTQMTLNTFHFAGRGDMNVTLGIPRLREILSASKNISTPSMDIPFLKKKLETVGEAEKFVSKLAKVTLANVLENVEVTESYSFAEERRRIYRFDFKFLPHSSYEDRYGVQPEQVVRYLEKHFVGKILLPGIKKEAKAQSNQSLFVASSARKLKFKEEYIEPTEMEGNEEAAPKDAVGAESESESDDEDPEAAKSLKRKDEAHYPDEEHDGEEKQQDDAYDDGIVGADTLDAHKKKSGEDEEEDDKDENAEEAQAEEEEEQWDDVQDVNEDWIQDFTFDSVNHLSCRLILAIPLCHPKVNMSLHLKKWAQMAVIYSVPNIKQAFVIEPESGGDVVIKTDGVDMRAMFKFADVLDVNRLGCNDVHTVLARYGVEVASQVIVKEMENLFKAYGITVNFRHLSLIASHMTSGGGYRPFSRHGMSDFSSPLQQATFETSTEFLKTAALRGKTDHLKNPSARLIMGLQGLEGTGSFELIDK